jgi:signal transduction histidine kinase
MKEWSKIIGFIGTMRNIDEKKRAEDKTEQKRKELEEQNKKLRTQEELKSKFVSNVSHDLRTPLTSIQGYSELLSSKVLGELNKEQIEASSVIHNEALRLGKLINDLLDASRIDAGAMVLHKKPFFISSLEEKCACRPLAYSKGLTVIWNTPDSIGEVYADPDRINQVLMNLVSNAIKYTERGSITVNSFKKDKKFIQIDVIDTGEGIQKRELDKIFERFYRVKDKGAKKEGTGLGLSIAKDIIELHEGELKVESVVSKGSKFSFTLPRFSAIKKEELKVEDMIDQDQNLLERSDTGYENKVIEAVETEINTKDKDILDVSSSSNSK